jgi:hypothetical protein
MQKSAVEKMKKTATATANSHELSGNFSDLGFLEVGESSSSSMPLSSSFNAVRFLGAAIVGTVDPI